MNIIKSFCLVLRTIATSDQSKLQINSLQDQLLGLAAKKINILKEAVAPYQARFF